MVIVEFVSQKIVYYNEEEAAEKLGKTERTLSELRRGGKLASCKRQGKIHFREETLINYMNKDEGEQAEGKKKSKKKK